MRKPFRSALLAALALAGAAGTARAQVAGLPVVNSGVISGFGLALDGGLPNDDAGGGYAVGATAALGLGPIGFTARLSRYKPDEAEELWSGGATANLKVFGGPLIPLAVTLQAGAGYSNPELSCIPVGACDVNEWRFPVGLGVSLGRRVRLEGSETSFVPYLHPVVVPVLGDDVGDDDVQIALGLGVDIKFSRSFDVRVAGAIGDDLYEGVSIGLAFIR